MAKSWRAESWFLTALVFVLLLCPSGTALALPSTVTLEFEGQALDLDTGVVCGGEEEEGAGLTRDLLFDHPEADLIIAFHADRAVHAVLIQNAMSGVQIAFLEDTPFESVDASDIAGLTFTQNVIDEPFGWEDTLVLLTDAGSHFKVGRAEVDLEAGIVTFDYELLSGQVAQTKPGADAPAVALAEGPTAGSPVDAPASLPPGLSVADWKQISGLVTEASYRIEAAAEASESLVARNAENHLRAVFDESGVRIEPLGEDSSSWKMRLTLRGYGYEGQIRPVEPVIPTARGHRLEYQRNNLVEWYVNDERGLEQGFTLAARPGENPDAGLLRFEMAVPGSLEAGTADDGSAVFFRDARGESVLRYAGLRVWDADGRELPARMVGDGQQLTILVDDRNAVYPVIVDPTLTEDAKLTASDAAGGDRFGLSVALSGDTALVGAYGDDDAGTNSGSAYVFTRNGTTWSEQAKLTATDGAAEDRFGRSVALSGDTALVGAHWDDDAGTNSGSTHVFVRNGTTWSEQAKLTATDAAAGDYFGYSVALSGDTALVGARLDDDAAPFSGSAYVFTRNGTTWSEQAKLTATDAAKGDAFGGSVALSGDTALVGTNGDDDAGINSGSTYVFVRNGTTWSEQVKLTATDAAAWDVFGGSVALSGDTALVGAVGDDDAGDESGSAYVFTRNGTTWSEQAKLTARHAAAWDEFGYSVALSGDTALVGAYGDHDAGLDSGSAYVFTRDGTTWSEEAKLTASDAAFRDRFGYSGALSGDTALVGAYGDDDAGTISGSAYVFEVKSKSSQCHQNSVGVASSLGIVEVCAKAEADALVGGEESSICVDANQAETPCSGSCPFPCDCIVENYFSPNNNYKFRKTCEGPVFVASCPGDTGYACDFTAVTYDCPCVCRRSGDPGGVFPPGCSP